MQYFNKLKATGMLLGLALFAAGSQTALALGTPSGTPINNTATVDYQVGAVSQTQEVSNIASFVVDNRVDVTVAETTTTYIDVVPGSNTQVITFTVTNTGNTAQDYFLSAAPNGTDPFGGTDNFDATNVSVFVETDGTSGYLAGADIDTFIDELAPDATVTVYIIADIPLGRANGDIAAYTLTAVTYDAGAAGLGAITIDDSGVGDSPILVNVVFGDGVGDTDAASDGTHSDSGAYRVLTAALTVSKSVAVISDPFSAAGFEKAIPGAVMEYTIVVQNTSATTAASNVVIVDAAPANTAYNTDSTRVGGIAQTDAADGDVTELVGANITVTLPTLAAGVTETITFRVTIN